MPVRRRHHSLWTFVLPLFSLQFVSGERVPGYSINTAEEVSAQFGLCVHVPCTFFVPDNEKLSPNAKGLWFKVFMYQDDLLVASKAGSGPNTHQRFILTGDVSKGDCSFSILDVQRWDESRYRFRVEDSIRFNYADIRPFVRVKDVTDKPVISPISSLVAGKEVTLTCVGLGRCSVSQQNISWSGSTSHQNVSVVRDIVSNKDGSTTYYSNLTFTPSREAHGSSINCEMIYVYSRKTIRANVTLDVQYGPIVNINATGELEFDAKENASLVVTEGKSISLNCTVDSNPVSNITWWKGSYKQNIEGVRFTYNTHRYELRDVLPDDADIYFCHAQNQHGNSSRFFNITVKYSPRKPKVSCLTGCSDNVNSNFTSIVNATEGSPVHIVCSAESFPPAELFWSRTGHGVISTSTSRFLTVSRMTLADEGTYMCNASNSIGTSSNTITIQMIYPPKPGQNSSCSMKGSSVVCTCFMESFPAATITWRVDSKEYSGNSSNDKVWIVTVQTRSNCSSNLTIELTDSKKPVIQCLGSNGKGNYVISYNNCEYWSPLNVSNIQ
uniref:Ig-like domain-containing protein n=1 Tax=Leptobrachium leishanense TaxID=445787 RepID=A0A8C5QD32_9ANUR